MVKKNQTDSDERLPMERKKREERKSNLKLEETSLPEDRSPMWDSETGHLLSYFLGGDNSNQGNGVGSPSTHNSTDGHFQHKPVFPLHHTAPMNNLFGNRPAGDTLEYDDDPVPPSTPATQYYHQSHSSKPKGKPSSSQRQKSSNNPLTKLKVSFAPETTGHMHHGDNSQHSTERMSPISPTTMIGPDQEQLMLPPPTSDKSGNNNSQSQLDWLQRISTIAKFSKMEPPRQQHYNMPPMSLPPPPHQIPGMSHSMAYNTMPVAAQPAVQSMPAEHLFYPQFAHIKQQAAGAGESEEKRIKRLERNRESARKSRRRKREHLSHLEEKVSKLYNQIEAERRKKINSMDAALKQELKDSVIQFINHAKLTDEELKESSLNFIETTGPNSNVRRAVVEFQYSTLKQTILPTYQKLLLWLTLHEEKYFVKGKEMHSCQEGRQEFRMAPGKISSKQVGEELANGRKLEDGHVESSAKRLSDANGENANQTAHAFDETRTWPLLCYELSVSVDQEERYMQAHKKVQEQNNIDEKRSQIAAATRMASNLKEAMMYQSHAAAMRSKRSFIEILTPKQTVLYQEWLASNRSRCEDILTKRKHAAGLRSPNSNTEKFSLLNICKRLEEVVISQETNV